MDFLKDIDTDETMLEKMTDIEEKDSYKEYFREMIFDYFQSMGIDIDMKDMKIKDFKGETTVIVNGKEYPINKQSIDGIAIAQHGPLVINGFEKRVSEPFVLRQL